MTKRNYLLMIIFQLLALSGTAQEFWSGTKSATSTISRTGNTHIGSLLFRFGGNTGILEHAEPAGDFYIRSVANGVSGDSGNLILNDIGGNVGIGTASPHASLHIAQSNLSNTPLAPIVLSRYWLDDTHTRASAIFHYSDGSNDKLVIAIGGLGGSFNSPISIDQAKLVVQGNGNVGIGTTKPEHKLSVKGVVQATEINVTTTDWPDYVFEEDYRLPDLKELESQIKQTGRLPGMPSAATLEEEGVDLSKMMELQQKKIEELTLYLIQQQKQITQLSSLTQTLQKKLTDEHQ